MKTTKLISDAGGKPAVEVSETNEVTSTQVYNKAEIERMKAEAEQQIESGNKKLAEIENMLKLLE